MKVLLSIVSCFLASFSFANDPADSFQIATEEWKKIDSIESTLNYKTGTFVLGDGIATLKVPLGFKFLEADEAKHVIEDLWGNLAGQAPLGMIFPESSSATITDYAFIIEFQPLGYVKDEDADEINYDDLLKQMQEEGKTANEERRKQGLTEMNLLGWAAKPHYDKQKKILYWAKEFNVEGYDEHTLNYDVRILGRKGVLVLQAVSGMSALDSVNQNIANILSMVSFNEGNRYSNFDSKTDNVAAWTIGSLVAGKVLAKAGFFAFVLKFLKFILLGLVAAGGAIFNFFKRKKKNPEYIQENNPEPIEETTQS